MSTAIHPQKVWKQFVGDVYFILKRKNMENISMTSKIFIKTLRLLSRMEVMENKRFLTLY